MSTLTEVIQHAIAAMPSGVRNTVVITIDRGGLFRKPQVIIMEASKARVDDDGLLLVLDDDDSVRAVFKEWQNFMKAGF